MTSAANLPSLTNADRGVGAFPGPRVSGICMIVAPLLAAVGTALGIPIYQASGVAFVRTIDRRPVLSQLALNFTVAGIVLFLLAIVAIAHRIAVVRPGLGRAAGVLAVIGMAGPVYFEGIYWSATQDLTADPSTVGTLMDRAQVVPRTVMNISGPAIVIGFALLGAGAALAGVLGRVRAGLLAAACLMPFGFISGYLVIATVGFGCAAVALVPWGATLLSGQRESTPSTDPATDLSAVV